MKLTENFSLKEMTQSQTALKNNIDNEPNAEQIENNVRRCSSFGSKRFSNKPPFQ